MPLHLGTRPPKLGPCPAGTYLEAALASGAADPATYEQELAKIYLERVVGSPSAAAAAGAGGPQPPAAAGAGGEAEGPPAQAAEEYGKLKRLVGGALGRWFCNLYLRGLHI